MAQPCEGRREGVGGLVGWRVVLDANYTYLPQAGFRHSHACCAISLAYC